MTITVKLNAVERFARGVDYDDYMTSYFANFAFSGWPYILGGDSQYEGNQIALLDNLAGRSTKTIVLDGNDISYTLANHRVSGTLNAVSLGTLGDSYRAPDSFTQNGAGNIIRYAAGDSSDPADPSVLLDALASEAHTLIGSAGGDTYTGTRFGDTLAGNDGNDALFGAGGNDRINGGAGKDRLSGGAGADSLTGGLAGDVFVFSASSDSTVALSGRETILDFSQAQRDRIDLSALDANARQGGNQAFTFIGDAAFSDTAGELRVERARSDTYITGDLNGDGREDFAIRLDDAISLTSRDFVL